jgi:sugar lactone lactonase YvrE
VIATTLAAYGGGLNDMHVDRQGRAYVTPFAADFPDADMPTDRSQASVPLLMVDGSTVHRVAEDLAAPNGVAMTADGSRLIVAETAGRRLTAFDVAPDGTLSGRRLFADLGERVPDGICVDIEGAVWVGCVFAEEFIRVAEGGEVMEVIPVPGRWAVAPTLGGSDGRTLFCATARTSLADFHEGKATGTIESARVAVPGVVSE